MHANCVVSSKWFGWFKWASAWPQQESRMNGCWMYMNWIKQSDFYEKLHRDQSYKENTWGGWMLEQLYEERINGFGRKRRPRKWLYGLDEILEKTKILMWRTKGNIWGVYGHGESKILRIIVNVAGLK